MVLGSSITMDRLAEIQFLIFCLELSVDRFTENARLVRKDPYHQNLEPAARQFAWHPLNDSRVSVLAPPSFQGPWPGRPVYRPVFDIPP